MKRTSSWGAALIAIAVVGLTGCTKHVDSSDVEKKISQQLQAQLGQTVKTQCPGSLEAKKGKTYSCTVTAQDGSKARGTLRMVNGDGRFTFQLATGR